MTTERSATRNPVSTDRDNTPSGPILLVVDDDPMVRKIVVRGLKDLDPAEVLEVVRERFSPADGADTFVLKLVDDPDFRAACTKAISSDAVSFAHPARPATGKPGPAAWD